MSVLGPPFDAGAAGAGRGALSGPLWWLERAFERGRAADKPEDDTRLRIFLVLALFAAGFFTLGLAATRAALFSGLDVAGESTVLPAGARADIVDRNGEVMAMDLVHYGLYLEPREIADKAGTAQALTAAIPTLDRARLEKDLAGDKPEYYLVGGLTPDTKVRIHDLALPGVDFEEETARAYPLGETTAHLIGFAGRDGRGLSGVERALDPTLRAAGHAPVALSIDLRVQGALHDELEAAATHFRVVAASGIVVNVRTGEILAMASWPTYDPNRPGSADPASLIDHAAASVYEPGSVFKVFTLAMGIDSGVATVDSTFDVHTPLVLPGQTIHDYDKGDRILPLWEVFTHSSNIGAARLGLECGADRMDRYFRSFGLFRAAPSELAESASPITPRRLSENIVASMSFGHAISESPLAVATGMSAILNGGVYRPLTLRKLEPGQAPAPGRRVIQASTSRTMLNLMRLNAVIGTGRKADVPGYRVGGKTGTAMKIVNGHYSRAKNVSSFAAVFPTDAPFGADRYYVLIMLDTPQAAPETGGFTTGGVTAAPTAGKVIARIAPLLGVARMAQTAKVDPKAPVDTRLLTEGED
ncbi:MAG: peptidoglycan D,D-transpeptidase FtsI family protein [Caulobacteraceae bacterium]